MCGRRCSKEAKLVAAALMDRVVSDVSARLWVSKMLKAIGLVKSSNTAVVVKAN